MAPPRRYPLALLPVVALVFGCLEYGPARGPESGSVLQILHALTSLALVFVWFLLDARERGYRASIVLQTALIVLTVVALPYYLFRSRGLAGGFRALALSVAVFAGTMIAYHLGSLFG